MAFVLTIAEGKDRGRTFEFDAASVTIGRANENDVVLFDPGVSRTHAKIVGRSGRYFVADNGSANGTLVNGAQVPGKSERELKNGDAIGVGPFVFRFAPKGQPQTAATGAETRIKKAAAPGDAQTRVSASPRDVASPAAPRVTAPRAGAPAGGAAALADRFKELPRNQRLGVAVGGVALLGMLVLAVLRAGGPGERQANGCPDVIDLSQDLGTSSFGDGAVEYVCGNAATFGYNLPPKTRAILHYTPLRIKPGAVEVKVDGKRVGVAAVAREDQALLLDQASVDGGKLLVSFSAKGGEWAIGGVRLETIALVSPDPARAKRAYDLGVSRWESRNVAPRNAYDAYTYFKDARRFLEAAYPRPDLYQAIAGQLHDAERELHKTCERLMFSAQRHEKYDETDKALKAYKEVLAYFPGEDPSGCRRRALASIPSASGGGEE